MSNRVRPLARTDGLIVQSVDAETVVYDTATNKAYVLSPSASAVWRACNGKRTIRDLAQLLGNDSPADEHVVWYALGELKDLLEEPVTLPTHLSGISRRRFLRMTGAVAAGVAIPVVVTMVAPAPAAAQSPAGCCTCVDGSSFTTPDCGQCRALCDGFGGGLGSCTCGA
jgi:hypothetical protein